MEQRLANSWRMTLNEKKFIENALSSDIRIDGRGPFEYRRLTIKFGREDGQSEIQLGQTHVMAYVTAQLVQPYRDRPNEGTLSIFTEFSPMADPSFEVGRPGELAVELGRVIDRGLRESRAVDMESLCVVSGRFVWAVRVDLHILDNGGNLIDAANIAALAALLTFRRPECIIGGEDGQEVTVYPPEVREPLCLIIHHLPVAVTFAVFSEGKSLVIDPTYHEEAVMRGRMTATMNSNGDVCAVQKAGGEGLMSSEIMRCLRIASVKAAEITHKIREAVDAYNQKRTLSQIKRHTRSTAVEVNLPDSNLKTNEVDELAYCMEKVKDEPDKSRSDGDNVGIATCSSQLSNSGARAFVGAPSKWDPYSRGFPDSTGKPVDLPGSPTMNIEEGAENCIPQSKKVGLKGPTEDLGDAPSTIDESILKQQMRSSKSLKDAVKPKHKRNK